MEVNRVVVYDKEMMRLQPDHNKMNIEPLELFGMEENQFALSLFTSIPVTPRRKSMEKFACLQGTLLTSWSSSWHVCFLT